FITKFKKVGTTWTLLSEVEVRKGADGFNGKTIEVFNASKIGGYAVGDSVYFSNTGKKSTYLVIAVTSMGESPITHPAKFELVGGGDISNIEYVLEDAISGEGEDDVETTYTLNSTYWEQNGLNTNGTNGGT